MGLLIISALLLAVLLVRLYREPRRLSNGIYLLLFLLFFGMWLLTLVDFDTRNLVVSVLLAGSPLFVVVLAAFLVANGWILLRREGRRPANALTLITGLGIIGLIVVLAAVAVLALDTESVVLVVAAASVVMVASYIGFLFTAFLLYSVIYGRMPQRSRHGAIVVLGASVREGRVRPLLANRLDRAAELYRAERAAGGEPVLVTSGGQGADEPASEARVMADYLRSRGIPAGAVLEEGRSTSTRENVEFSAALLAERGVEGRVLVVTSNFHVLRAAILTRRSGMVADVRGARTARYYLPNALLREFVALLVQYWVPVGVSTLLVALVFPLLAWHTGAWS
ncbi:uncharacterized SAM-binding protein YcdF (DUF218 family) [Herbihabitans rhizosphaerae]|uniref:Uncharacterized SAM-binding protein YcdF (DUF218 family) n=1 Tax=Herbihabitans rhizosphaerae TaxID=1872711 RepID=A0A4Q7KKZ2_9PSEU|nr:YdcF family protein [Herbihabitans rhizosphaerae]RZS36560.1 uncharacterized SAM-binding protein YcdF (DUF218 family) [Herbihabitans rhizosphaerae]